MYKFKVRNIMAQNTSKIYKVTLDGNFTQIPNETLQSEELSAEEIYLICNLCSRPEGWVFIKTKYWKQTQLGRDRYNKAWKGLSDKGYIQSVKRMKGNLVDGYDYKISYLPIFGLTEVQTNRDSDLPNIRDYIKTEDINTEYINKDFKKEGVSINSIDTKEIPYAELFMKGISAEDYLKNNY